jgi:hypothetical protein
MTLQSRRKHQTTRPNTLLPRETATDSAWHRLASAARPLCSGLAAALFLTLLPGAAMAEPGNPFRGSQSGAWSTNSSSSRSASGFVAHESSSAREASSSEQPRSTTKLNWRPVRSAATSALRSQSNIQLTAGEGDRYQAQRAPSQINRGPAARTAQSQTRSVLGAQDPFESDGQTAPRFSAPGAEKEATETEDTFPMTEQPSTTKKLDPFDNELPPTRPNATFPTDEPTEDPVVEPTEEPAEAKPMPKTFKKSPSSPSDHEAESNAQTDKVDCEEGRRIVQASGLDSISLNIYQRGRTGVTYPEECPLWDEAFMARCWAETTYTWKASSLCHKPLYFEDVQLERYGHEWGPLVQPVVSAAHFFGTLPILPYKMGLETPNECVYALGYYRPNSCAPYMIEPLGFTWRAALFEAGAVVGTAAVLP